VIRDPRILVERSYYAVGRGNDRQRNAGGDRPCPMLVAPDSSDKNFTKLRFKFSLLGVGLLHSPHVRGPRLSLHESSHLNLRFSKYV
jgi:hypothetical protein